MNIIKIYISLHLLQQIRTTSICEKIEQKSQCISFFNYLIEVLRYDLEDATKLFLKYFESIGMKNNPFIHKRLSEQLKTMCNDFFNCYLTSGIFDNETSKILRSIITSIEREIIDEFKKNLSVTIKERQWYTEKILKRQVVRYEMMKFLGLKILHIENGVNCNGPMFLHEYREMDDASRRIIIKTYYNLKPAMKEKFLHCNEFLKKIADELSIDKNNKRTSHRFNEDIETTYTQTLTDFIVREHYDHILDYKDEFEAKNDQGENLEEIIEEFKKENLQNGITPNELSFPQTTNIPSTPQVVSYENQTNPINGSQLHIN